MSSRHVWTLSWEPGLENTIKSVVRTDDCSSGKGGRG